MKNLIPLLPVLLVACSSAPEPQTENTAVGTEVNIYSHRHYDTDKALFAMFTERTGIHVNVVQAGDDELMARLEAEGPKSPCDLFITADAGRLGMAQQRGLLQPVKSAVLEQNIPAHLRHPEGYWFGLTMRARIVAFNKNTVDPAQIGSYGDLATARWKGKVLVRSSENVYNQSLLAAMIAHNGPLAAKAWADGIVANMAREPQGGDTDQLLAVAAGIGDVAIVNSYYLAKLMAGNEPEKEKARAVLGAVFPSLEGHGTHVNISGGGVAKHAPHKAAAVALLEFLAGDEAQRMFSDGNKEYPVKVGVPIAPELAAFGPFTPDTLNLEALSRLNADAVKVFDAAGWR